MSDRQTEREAKRRVWDVNIVAGKKLIFKLRDTFNPIKCTVSYLMHEFLRPLIYQQEQSFAKKRIVLSVYRPIICGHRGAAINMRV